MLKLFFPDHFYQSIYEIDLDELKKSGYKGLVLDLDNTIVARNSETATEDLKKWLERLEEKGFKACIVSNNWKQRVASIAAQVNLPLVARAAKPRKGAFKRAMNVLGTNKKDTVVIGDQIFTDVFGGNLSKLRTILVTPMSNHEAPHTHILRHFERWIMKRWKAKQDFARE